MKFVELNDGVNVHTKINKNVKRTIERMNQATGIDQNVIINSILTNGLGDKLFKSSSRVRRGGSRTRR